MVTSWDTIKAIDDIFHPHSIAVVGTSPIPFSGYQYLRFLVDSGYRNLYPAIRNEYSRTADTRSWQKYRGPWTL